MAACLEAAEATLRFGLGLILIGVGLFICALAIAMIRDTFL